jgi:hypothetical protein
MRRLLKTSPMPTLLATRDAVVILLGFYAALSVDEALSLRMRDVEVVPKDWSSTHPVAVIRSWQSPTPTPLSSPRAVSGCRGATQ